jgi:cytochrome c-type biogenesis protein CcmE
MSTKAAKIGLTSVVLAVALGALLWSTLSEGTEYYKHVDEVMAQPAQWYGKPLQLHGYVVKDNGQVVNAAYRGVVPDTFKDNAEVVIKGRLSPEGFTVEPNGVLAKCPSKYQAKESGTSASADGAQPAPQPRAAAAGSF